MKNFSKFILIILTLILVNGCSGFFKRSDVKDNPINVEDRVRKNIEEGRGVRFNIGKEKEVFLILHQLTNYGEHQLKLLILFL